MYVMEKIRFNLNYGLFVKSWMHRAPIVDPRLQLLLLEDLLEDDLENLCDFLGATGNI